QHMEKYWARDQSDKISRDHEQGCDSLQSASHAPFGHGGLSCSVPGSVPGMEDAAKNELMFQSSVMS
ncbi:hypothetical protein PSZ87_22750, partial [Shigella sonnei]|nr:hypothetical protein [Shigella sonnei]